MGAKYRITATVKEIKGHCPVYRVGDKIVFERFYIKAKHSGDVCMHALAAMSTLLSAFLHGSSAKDLGMGSNDDIGYLQCPDPGPPCTKGGTVVFELRRERIEE